MSDLTIDPLHTDIPEFDTSPDAEDVDFRGLNRELFLLRRAITGRLATLEELADGRELTAAERQARAEAAHTVDMAAADQAPARALSATETEDLQAAQTWLQEAAADPDGDADRPFTVTDAGRVAELEVHIADIEARTDKRDLSEEEVADLAASNAQLADLKRLQMLDRGRRRVELLTAHTADPVEVDAAALAEATRQLGDLETIEAGRDLTAMERRERNRLTRRLETVTERIVLLNYGLVKSYVSRFTSVTSRHDSEDYMAAGLKGLMVAIDRYDPDKGLFAQWARNPIRRAVIRELRDREYQTMGHGDFERRPDIHRARKQVMGDRTEDPTDVEIAEIADIAGVKPTQAARVLRAASLTSLHAPITGTEQDYADVLPADADVEGDVLRQMDADTLKEVIFPELHWREWMVLHLRFGLSGEREATLESIGKLLELSREAVRHVEAKAFSKVVHPILSARLLSHGRV